MNKRGKLAGLTLALLGVAWGCSIDETDLGSNRVGEGGESGASGADGQTSGSGGSGAGRGGSTNGGSSAKGGSSSGGSSGKGTGATGEAGNAGEPSRAGSGSGGSAGAPECSCPYPPLLGGDCCAVRDACETDGVSCEVLRTSIIDLRAWDPPSAWGSDELEDAWSCEEKISVALVERCAFVAPECPGPAEENATFGDPEEQGYSECTDAETRASLRCGEPGSYYAPSCCQRQRCVADEECESGRCIFRRVQSHQGPGAYPHISECQVSERGCGCGGPEVAEPHTGYCIGDDEELARFDCDVESKTCEELFAWDDDLLSALGEDSPRLLPEAIEAYWSCEDKVWNELALRCEGAFDCRDTPCPELRACTECPDPEGDSHWLCLRPADTCPQLEGQAGAGSGD
jgi:hypothetical protein